MPTYLGPFTGEAGYEISAWIPFLWKRLGEGFKDCIAISRGKTDCWYPCPVVNAYDYLTYAEFRDLFMSRRFFYGSFNAKDEHDCLDKTILDRIGVKSDIRSFEIDFDYRRRTLQRHFHVSKPERYPGLPDHYIAVRLYKNGWLQKLPKCLPKTKLPIVKIALKEQIDDHDHDEFGKADILLDPYDSFDVHSRIVAHADMLIAPYGGLSYTGPKLGVPTIGLSSHGPWPDHQKSMVLQMAKAAKVSYQRKHIDDLEEIGMPYQW